ncbi:SH3 domain-containing protein [Bacillus sp. V59.32b]|uniref:SH3 domain-containing protein n=1 Tax=Bacillus sp. V59.32b TaxID=1758642 RepID=UPI000E3C8630|nr:SH3 domain-containing protein [Bacillus sp. V59.32b]RFU67043.1 SH3 domain-containing protein [Bacillus sp. V59.32b]
MTKRFGALLLATTLLISLFTISVPANQVFASTTAKVNATTLNIREKPTTSSKVIGNYKKGQTITITQQQNGWSKVPVGKKNRMGILKIRYGD